MASYAGAGETTIYVGGLIEKVTRPAGTSWRHFIAGGSGPVAIYTRKTFAADEMHYLTRDHLGSVDSVTNGTGAVEVRLSYDAFGARRKEAGWSGAPTTADMNEVADTTRRSFTFHETLDNLNLVHMNGRVYDPKVGRFISADPFIPDPRHTQSFNRYSYVRNNPLSATDPSGFCEDYATCHWIDGPLHIRGDNPAQFPSVVRAVNEARGGIVLPGTPPPPAAPDPANPAPPGAAPAGENPSAAATSCPRDIMGCASETAEKFRDFLIGENGGEAWKEAWNEDWVPGPTGGKVPPSIAAGLEEVRSRIPADASKNGMHAWHAGSNAYLAKQYGLLGMAPVLFAGAYHESPADWGSFWAEQYWQGTVNHGLDSATDMTANSYGYVVGLFGGDGAVDTAMRTGNYIPGPGEPDPTFGGNGRYRGNPSDAWGQYPQPPPGGH